MGDHSVPRGEKSTAGGANGSPRRNESHKAKHRLPDTTTPDTRSSAPRASRLRVPKWLGGKG